MSIRSSIRAAAAATILTAATAFGQFEGAVRMRAVTYGDADSNVVASTVYFKGRLFAAVIDSSGNEGQAGRFILRPDSSLMWIVIDAEKKYMEIPLPEKGRSPDTAARDAGKRSYTLTKTGKTRTVIGYPCDEWIAEEEDGASARIWATTKLGDMYEGVVKWFDEMSMESDGGKGRWERELAGMKYFPLSVVRSEEGEVTETEEVTAVDRMKVADSVFEAPAGYQKQVMDLNFDRMFEKMMKDMEKHQDDEPDTSGDGDGGQ